MADNPPVRKITGKTAYATLLTRPSYLAGAILLGYTLTKHSADSPLIILYTPETFPDSCVEALRTEAKWSNIIPHPVDHLRLPPSPSKDALEGGKQEKESTAEGMVAARFVDTWSKLRVFDSSVFDLFPKDLNMDECQLCFLDADMMIFKDPSSAIFAAKPEPRSEEPLKVDELLASHVCVCNLDRDAWAPKEWKEENCAYTPLTTSTQIPPAKTEPATHGLFNSGTFVFRPTSSISEKIFSEFDRLAKSGELAKMKFPDQDFLNQVFRGDWRSLHWSVNALKTWRYWHTNMWSDSHVTVLHYIVDKPWAKRVSTSPSGEEVAGYKGDDGETHSWWWSEFSHWKEERLDGGEEGKKEVSVVGRYVDGEAEGQEHDEDMKAIGGGVQDFAKKWVKGDGKEDEQEQGPHGPVLRKKMLGERGHGPVVRGGFGGRGGRGSGYVVE